MVDLKSYYASLKADPKDSRNDPNTRPIMMDRSDLRNWTSDCACPICIKKTEHLKLDSKFTDINYNGITNIHTKRLTDHHYFLCPKEIYAFIFKTRSWGKYSI
jgi:hypothetical protein